MSFFDISNGCGSCSDFNPMGNGMNMNSLTQLDPNTQYLANMVASATSANSSNHVAGGSLNQYPNQSSEVLSHQNMSNHFNNAAGGQPQQRTGSTSINQLPNAQPSVNNANKRKQMVNQKYNMEVENDEMNGAMAYEQLSNSGNCYIMLGLVIVAALAWNETIRFYINQSIKLNDGSPSYYIGYAVVATLVAFALYMYLTK